MTTAEKKHRQAWWAFWLAVFLLLLVAAVWFIYAGPALKKRQAEGDIREIQALSQCKKHFMVYSRPHWLGLAERIPSSSTWIGKIILNPLQQWQKEGGVPSVGLMDMDMSKLSLPERRYLYERLQRLPLVAVGRISCCSKNDLTGIGKHPRLESLEISGLGMTDMDLSEFGNLPNLTELTLSRTAVSGNGLKLLGRLPRLEHLDLSRSEMTDTGLQGIGPTPRLRTMNLSKTFVTDNGLKALGLLPDLEMLNLSQTKVTDAGLKQLGKLRYLNHS